MRLACCSAKEDISDVVQRRASQLIDQHHSILLHIDRKRTDLQDTSVFDEDIISVRLHLTYLRVELPFLSLQLGQLSVTELIARVCAVKTRALLRLDNTSTASNRDFAELTSSYRSSDDDITKEDVFFLQTLLMLRKAEVADYNNMDPTH
ncbi:hypothetical protein Tco_1500495 [Tanacetum coccineum]